MIAFNNVSLLSYNENKKFFGENGFHFSTEKNISVQGYLYDFYATSGIGSGVISGINALDIISKSNYDELFINGKNFGSGYISNFNVEKGNWTRLTNYTADIIAIDTGNFEIQGQYFYTPSGISGNWSENILGKALKNVDSASSYTDIKKTYDPQEYTLNAGLEISFNPAFDISVNLNAVRDLAKFLKPPISNIKKEIDPLGTGWPMRSYVSEKIDEINKKYTTETSYSQLYQNPDGLNYFQFSVSLSDDGTVSASETARILKPENISGNSNQIFSVFAGAFSGVLTLLDIDNYANIGKPESQQTGSAEGLAGFLARYGLSNAKMQIVGSSYGESEDYYERETKYSNSDSGGKHVSGFSFKKSKNFKKNEDNTSSCTVNLTIKGDGQPGSSNSWSNALAGFVSKKEEANNDALNGVGFDSDQEYCNQEFPSAYIDGFNLDISKYDGSINYSITATNKPLQATGITDGNEYSEYTITKNEPPRVEYKEYNIFNNGAGSLVQIPYSQTSLGTTTVTITRKYKNDSIFGTAPSFPPDQPFTISKKTRKSNGSSETEVVYHYHQ